MVNIHHHATKSKQIRNKKNYLAMDTLNARSDR
jgi:hypothetical protein